tara:strand:- start:991 stop:1197 length:207 start_codon:yes stop_codon:yes gene_type:complete
MLQDMTFSRRDELFLTYKQCYLDVHGKQLSNIDELILIRSEVSEQELKKLIDELDDIMIKRALYSINN